MIQGDLMCDGQITVCKAKGRLTFPEIRAKVIDLRIAGVARRVLCDLSHATVADLTSIEIEDLIKLISQYVTDSRGGKAAIIAHRGVDYDLARIFGTFAELAGLPVKVRVFQTSEIAKAWLQESAEGVLA